MGTQRGAREGTNPDELLVDEGFNAILGGIIPKKFGLAIARNLSISATVSLTTRCRFRSSDRTTSGTVLPLTGSSRSATRPQTLRLVFRSTNSTCSEIFV